MLREDAKVELQDRDLQLLRGLLDSRLITLAQARAIYFDCKQEMCKKRMAKLKAAGLIGERPRRPNEPAILYLARGGFEAMRARGLLDELPEMTWPRLERRLRVSDLTLRHELEVNDVRAAFCRAVRNHPQYTITEFTTWPALIEFNVAFDGVPAVLVRPDAFLHIQEQEQDGTFESTCFVEMDRSSEVLDTLVHKARCYLAYYQSGGLAERFGHSRSEYKDFPFRVLMIFKTAERRNNLAERLLLGKPPILTQVWLSTMKEVKEDPLGPIWIRPKDYREATDWTIHSVSRASSGPVYRRQAERDAFVESSIAKHRLLGADDAQAPAQEK